MPTRDQLEELRTKCTWKWTTQNGVNGTLVTSPNGNSMFLPAAGFRWFGGIGSTDYSGDYWSRTLFSTNPCLAFRLIFFSEGLYWSQDERLYGYPVRAVRVYQN